jgi:hypothetical protein
MADLSGKKRLVVAIGDNSSLAFGAPRPSTPQGPYRQ